MIRIGGMLVFIAVQFRKNLASLSRQFSAGADHRFQFDKRGQLFIRTHNESLSINASAAQDRARIVFDCRVVNDPAMIN